MISACPVRVVGRREGGSRDDDDDDDDDDDNDDAQWCSSRLNLSAAMMAEPREVHGSGLGRERRLYRKEEKEPSRTTTIGAQMQLMRERDRQSLVLCYQLYWDFF